MSTDNDVKGRGVENTIFACYRAVGQWIHSQGYQGYELLSETTLFEKLLATILAKVLDFVAVSDGYYYCENFANNFSRSSLSFWYQYQIVK